MTEPRVEPTALPHAYLLAKLAMVMPLFEEARDALCAISITAAKLHHVELSLGNRMDIAGTFSLEDWRREFPERAAPPVLDVRLREALKDCADLLDAFVQGHYACQPPDIECYPYLPAAEEAVEAARAALALPEGGDGAPRVQDQPDHPEDRSAEPGSD